MRALVVMTALLVAYPATAFAGATETAQPAVDSKQTVVPTKVVCRQVQETGTRFKKKVCGRPADWQRREEESARARKELDSGGGANTAPSG